jgi:hypothetical protein
MYITQMRTVATTGLVEQITNINDTIRKSAILCQVAILLHSNYKTAHFFELTTLFLFRLFVYIKRTIYLCSLFSAIEKFIFSYYSAKIKINYFIYKISTILLYKTNLYYFNFMTRPTIINLK